MERRALQRHPAAGRELPRARRHRRRRRARQPPRQWQPELQYRQLHGAMRLFCAWLHPRPRPVRMNVRDTQNRSRPVTNRPFIALAACAACLLPAVGSAAGPSLNIPDFSHLRAKAVESTDITFDGVLLSLAKKFAEHEDEEARQLLAEVKSVRVRNFEFDTD